MTRLALVLLVMGCGEKSPAPVATAAPVKCNHDRDCVGAWNPYTPPRAMGTTQVEVECGSTDRCVEGVCQTPPAVSGTPSGETGSVVFETPGGDKTFQVEVVSDSFQTSRGMMCRTSNQEGWGMLFLLRETRRQSFWMKNTLIPLDMVFIGEDWTVVGVVEGAPPRTLSGRGVSAPSRYVLELSAGAAKAAGIAAGVRMRYVPPAG